MFFEFLLLICGPEIPQGQCSPDVAVIERRYAVADVAGCAVLARDFVRWWHSERDGVVGQHFVMECRRLPDA